LRVDFRQGQRQSLGDEGEQVAFPLLVDLLRSLEGLGDRDNIGLRSLPVNLGGGGAHERVRK
jgi:hypothetical protein